MIYCPKSCTSLIKHLGGMFVVCKKYLETVQNFHVVTCNKEGLPGRKLCIFSETDFSQRTLVVIKFSTTSKLSETLTIL